FDAGTGDHRQPGHRVGDHPPGRSGRRRPRILGHDLPMGGEDGPDPADGHRSLVVHHGDLVGHIRPGRPGRRAARCRGQCRCGLRARRRANSRVKTEPGLEFWGLLDQTRPPEEDPLAHADALVEVLVSRGADAALEFADEMDAALTALYTWDLRWAANLAIA